MQMGMSSACFFCREVNENAVQRIGALGVRNGEVFFSSRSEYHPPLLDEICQNAADAGVSIHAVHSLCTQFEPQLFSRHERQRAEAQEVFTEVLHAAQTLGAHTYVFHGAMNVKRAKKLNIDFDWAARCVTRLAEESAQYGVKLAYETVHWCWYNQPEFAQELCRRVETDNLYFTLDIKQVAQSGYTLEAYLDCMGDRLTHIHLCDYRSDPQKGVIPCLPFAGEVDWVALRRKLRDMRFDGTMMLEVYPSDYQSYEELQENYRKVEAFFFE